MQIDLAQIILKAGEDLVEGFWRSDQRGNRILNSTEYPGRMYRALETFPEVLTELYRQNLRLAIEADKTLNFVEDSHIKIGLLK